MTRTASNASAGVDGPARTPRARGFTQAGQHHADMLRLARQRRVQRRRPLRRSAAGRSECARTARVSGVGSTTWAIANSAVSTAPRETLRPNASKQPGQQRGGQLRPVRFQRVQHLGGRAARVVGGRPHWSNTPAGRNGVGRISTYPLSASDFPIARRRFCTGGQAAPGRCLRQHRRDDLEALQPQHLFDEVGGLANVGPPAGRCGRDLTVVDDDLGADLGQPLLGGALRRSRRPQCGRAGRPPC